AGGRLCLHDAINTVAAVRPYDFILSHRNPRVLVLDFGAERLPRISWRRHESRLLDHIGLEGAPKRALGSTKLPSRAIDDASKADDIRSEGQQLTFGEAHAF